MRSYGQNKTIKVYILYGALTRHVFKIMSLAVTCMDAIIFLTCGAQDLDKSIIQLYYLCTTEQSPCPYRDSLHLNLYSPTILCTWQSLDVILHYITPPLNLYTWQSNYYQQNIVNTCACSINTWSAVRIFIQFTLSVC